MDYSAYSKSTLVSFNLYYNFIWRRERLELTGYYARHFRRIIVFNLSNFMEEDSHVQQE